MNGDSFFLFVDKPSGPTSQQILTRLKKKYGFKKIGHHGTLDPFASGIMLVGVGDATRYFQFVRDDQKKYTATLVLGEDRDTLDVTGEVMAKSPVENYSSQDVCKILSGFCGESMQVPPRFSAIKVDGKKSYARARSGEDFTLPPRPIFIHDISLLNWDNPKLVFSATVSRGTYIRSLARDIAGKMGTVGYLRELRREVLPGMEKAPLFNFEHDDLGEKYKIPIPALFENLPRLEISDELACRYFYGQRISREDLGEDGIIKATDKAGATGYVSIYNHSEFIGMGRLDQEVLSPYRVLAKKRV